MDPITALAGIQAAVALVKKVSKTIDDVSSLGPVLGKYFDAKSTAVKVVTEAKKSGKSSSMGTAIEIEMALEQAAQFERELQLLFMQTGKIDVWNKIKARSHALDAEAASEAKREKTAKLKKQKEFDEAMEFLFAAVFLIITIAGVGWGIFELMDYCKVNSCGG